MSVKAVVRQDSAQIRVVNEEDAKEIVDFTLVPVGSVVQARDGRHRSGLVGVGLHADTRVMADREQIVDNLETLVAGWVVDGGDVGDAGEFGCGVVLEEAEGGDNTGGRDVDGELVLPHGELLDVLGQTRHQVLSICVQAVGLGLVLVYSYLSICPYLYRL